LQPDGKIIAGGNFTSFNGSACSRIARLTPNGSFDNTFNIGDGFNNDVHALVIQPDGNILAGGLFTSFNNFSLNRMVRLTTSGSLDNGFNIGSGFDGTVQAISLQLDGKIIVGGSFILVNGTYNPGITRLNTNGSYDNTFTIRASATNTNLVLPDQRIVVGGRFWKINGVVRNAIAILNSDASLDSSFGIVSGLADGVFSLAVKSDGKILVLSNIISSGLRADGVLGQLNADGTVDVNFKPTVDESLSSLIIQNDGKIIITGGFSKVNGVLRSRIARLNTDGTLDASFNQENGFAQTQSYVYSIVLQSDGKLLVSGIFNSFGGRTRNRILRLNSDGSLDQSFNPGLGPNEVAYDMVVQPDGRIIICGNFTQFAGLSRNRIARLNSDGSLDTSFNPGTGFDNAALSLAMLPGDKLLVGGYFKNYNGKGREGLVRVNTDGSLDTSFDPDFFGVVDKLLLQPDGKILLVGPFGTIGGVYRGSVARLLPGGNLDTGFASNHGPSGFGCRTLALQSDGKVLVGGDFWLFDGKVRHYIARLFGDNTTFISSFSPNQGRVGAQVTINGGTFTGATAVTFNGVNAPQFTVNCPTQITVTVPPGTVTGRIRVTTPNGTATSDNDFVLRAIAVELTKTDVRCFGDRTGSLTINASSGSPNSGAFQYRVGATGTFTNFTPPLTLGNLAAGDYTVAVRQASIPDYEETSTATIGQPAAALALAAPAGNLSQPNCPTDVGSVTLVASGGTPPYRFRQGTGAFQGEAIFAGLAPGSYSFTVTDANDCTVAAPLAVSLAAQRQGPPVPTITPTGTEFSAVFTLRSSAAAGNQWLRDGQPIPGETGQSLNVTQRGSYAVRVTVDGCSRASAAITLTADEQLVGAAGLAQLFPNPSPGALTVRVRTGGNAARVVVYTVVGATVASLPLQRGALGGWEARLELGHLAPGQYYARIETADGPFTLPFVRE
jgi:uncharacterized delta-60 repeat protein